MNNLPNIEVIETLKKYLIDGRHSYGRGDKAGQQLAYKQAMQLAASNKLSGEELLFKSCLATIDGAWETANELLKKTLASGNLTLRTETLDRMAFVCNKLKDYTKSIELLGVVLQNENYEMRGDAWNNMGIAYANMKEYTKAIECYQKALAEKSNVAPGDGWNNMGNAYVNIKDYAKGLACYQKALDDKSYATPGKAWNNMGIAYVYMKDFTKALECYHKALADMSINDHGATWNNIGIVYAEMEDFPKALECYQKALDDKSYDSPGKAWNNMGITYADMEDFSKAIECYQKALDDKSYENPGNALNNMGIACANMKDYPKAIECYQKALAEKSFGKPGIAWNNMGISYSNMKDYAKALECYQKALDDKSYATPGNVLYNMALVHRNREHFESALDCLTEAAKAFRKTGQTAENNSVKMLRTVLNGIVRSRKGGQEGLEQRYLEAAQLAKPTVATPKNEGPASETISKSTDIRSVIEKIISSTTSTENYRQREQVDLGNWLICLRGWSSSTNVISIAHPEFYAGTKCCGGGFLLNWRNKAHIIDPGTDFLETFCKFNMLPSGKPPHILQVYSVQTTHRHPDHAGDLTAITQLDNDVAGTSDRKLQFHLDEDTYNNIPPLLRDRLGRDRVVVRILDPNLPAEIGTGSCSLNAFKVDHGNEAPNACGLSFSLTPEKKSDKSISVGFTGDTKWLPILSEKLSGCSVIVCNFSATRTADIGEQVPKKDHLGFLGLFELIKSTTANIYVVTEFWGQLGDIRIPITQLLLERIRETGRRTNNLPVIIPADVGLVIDVSSQTVMCSHCQQFVPAADIVTVPISPTFGRLLYLCPRHLMKQKEGVIPVI